MRAHAQTHLQLFAQLRDAGWSEADLARAGAAYELAVQAFAGRFRGSGKPFLAHLVGTASILCAEGAPPDVVLAGLLHATHAGAGPTAAARARVRQAVGREAEALVARYAASGWSAEGARRAARAADRLGAPDGAVALLRLANELEEYLDDALRYVAADKRDAVLARAEAAAELATALGRDGLARALAEQAGRARGFGAPPAWWRARGLSYTIAPAAPGGRLRRSALRAVASARRRLRALLGA